MGTTPEKCRQNVNPLREIMEQTTDPDTRRKLVEVVRAWEDLCTELEAKHGASAQQAAE